MTAEKPMNRLWPVFGAVLIQLCLGSLYAWSVFTKPLVEAGWTKADTQWVFSLQIVSFAAAMVLGGKLMGKLGPRKLSMLGGLILGAGYLLAGLLGSTNMLVLLFGVGLVAGAGAGFGYVVPIAVSMRWWPDKKGLITGVAVAGFGFGALFWIKIASEWGNLLGKIGLSGTFLTYGVAYAVLVGIGAVWMRFPPDGWSPAGFTAQASGAAGQGPTLAGGAILKTIQYYLIFICFAATSGAGLMSIGLMKLYPMEALQAAGMGKEAAGAVAGTAMGVFFALANGFGRIAWGFISDKTGRKTALVVMSAVQGVMVLLFPYMAGNTGLLYLAATIIGFNYGGGFALFPTLTADVFGAQVVGRNYPIMFIAYGIGGLFGPILGGKLGDMGNFPLAFSICGVLCLIGSACSIGVKPLKKTA